MNNCILAVSAKFQFNLSGAKNKHMKKKTDDQQFANDSP